MSSVTRIFSSRGAFVGRDAEITRLLEQAERPSGGITLLAAPFAGSSELLRQTFDRLFESQDAVIPFYFDCDAAPLRLRRHAGRVRSAVFVREFLLQTVAFRRRDAGIIAAAPNVAELAELADPADARWFDRVVESYERGNLDLGEALSTPMRAVAAGTRVFLMIDNMSALTPDMIESFRAVLDRSTMPFVVAGKRRDLFAAMPFESMHLDFLQSAEAGELVERLAEQTGVVINDETRDLIAVQLAGNPAHVGAMFSAAVARHVDLDTFERVEQIYTDEIFGGRISLGFDAVLDAVAGDQEGNFKIVELLGAARSADAVGLREDYFREQAGLDQAAIRHLYIHELLNLDSGNVKFPTDYIVLGDLVESRLLAGMAGVTRALAVGTSMAKYTQRAPAIMARSYRRGRALSLTELMAGFHGQAVPCALLDFRVFREKLKGASEREVAEFLKTDELFPLPRIVFTAAATAFYPRLAEVRDEERSAIAIGFDASGEEFAALVMEVDSKLEGTAETAAFWCDRLEMAALNCNFENYRIWLIAPEGFDDEALALLDSRGASGFSRRQVTMLAEYLGAGETKKDSQAFELTLPMGESSELFATRSIEDFARTQGFAAKAINQIKTAIVESLINAAEHGLSPDGRVTLAYSFTDERLTITIKNRGVRLADAAPKSNEARRGWGLKLIRNLMDEVNLGETDDGTEITMVKILRMV